MFRRLTVRLCASGVPESPHAFSSDRLTNIIVNSHKTPIGKVTDHFDKHLKDFFLQAENQKSLCEVLLRLDSEVGRLRVPPRVREGVLISISKMLESLSDSQILSIPRLLRRLPQEMVSCAEEDDVFEKFLQVFRDSLCMGASEQHICDTLVNVSRLHLKHPCKDEPIVRFFEALETSSHTSQVCVKLIRASATSVPKNKLAHPTIRRSLLNMIKQVQEVDLFSILRSISRLPVFPEASEFVVVNTVPSSSDLLIDGSVGLLSMLGGEVSMRKISDSITPEILLRVLEEAVGLNAINPGSAECLVGLVKVGKPLSQNSKAIAGYSRLLSSIGDQAGVKEAIKTLEPSIKEVDTASAVRIMNYMMSSSTEVPVRDRFLRAHLKPRIAELSSRDIKVLFRSMNSGDDIEWLWSRLANDFSSIKNPETVAELMVKVNKGAVADHLVKLLVSSQKDQELLVRVWKILTENGVAFENMEVMDSNSPRKRALKEVTRLLFRSVRMAPVE
jgi:hypothetical protein